jgi:hypothetical protein
MELAQDHVQWQALVLVTLKFWILLLTESLSISQSVVPGTEFSAANLNCYTLQEIVRSGSVRSYVLEPSGPGGHLVIHSIHVDGATHLQQFQGQSHSYFLWSW